MPCGFLSYDDRRRRNKRGSVRASASAALTCRTTYPLILKVVQAVVGQHEPAALPGLDAAALLREVALLLGVGVRRVAVVELDLVLDDAVVQRRQKVGRQVGALVDAAVVADELHLGHLVLLADRRVVRVGVEHDGREGENVRRVAARKHAVRVVRVVALCERHHHAVDLLRLARQAEEAQELAKRLVELWVATRVRVRHTKYLSLPLSLSQCVCRSGGHAPPFRGTRVDRQTPSRAPSRPARRESLQS